MKSLTDNPKLFDKLLGALVGFAIGDAMGATTEFMTKEAIEKEHGSISTIVGGGWLGLKPGEVTDDTQMMIEVANAYVASYNTGKAYENCCVGNFSMWYISRPKDIGNTCKTVISSCIGRSPEEWKKCALELNEKYESLGNGSLMRCLFPALLNDERAAISQGDLTHNNNTCRAIICFYTRTLQRYLKSTQTTAYGYSDHVEPTGRVDNTYKNALYWSHSSRNFKTAILGAVNDGGDADTIAALTGGLAGARWGFNRIPGEWVQRLDESIYNKLRQLAEEAMKILSNQEVCI